MKKKLLPFLVLCTSIVLVSCSSNMSQDILAPIKKMLPSSTPESTTTLPAPTEQGNIGGSIGKSMDSLDKEKLSHALDKPLGKSTQWSNGLTKITYTITPTKKVEIMNNPFCREYNMKEQRGEKSREVNGTACVDANSNWQAVSN